MSKANLNFDETNRELLSFLDHSPSAFHATANMCEMLKEAGCTRLYEGEKWKLEAGRGYYVARNDSALIAFFIPKKDFTGFQIMASHSDSPVFKIKANAEIEVENQYVKLNVEKYGGMICSTWLDRPLSVAGRVIVRTADGIATRLEVIMDLERVTACSLLSAPMTFTSNKAVQPSPSPAIFFARVSLT